jgi:prepilin-type processing-associated H-X9-DG protein/prepilin-type N-terminal cleavage/methylation domain-containing protein
MKKRMAPEGKTKIGFTLIEVLVSIGIIVILAALLVPAVAGAREKADAATCSQNLRQIGAAVLTFAGENQGICPTAGGVVNRGQVDASTGKAGWTEQLDAYIGENTKVYRCPGSARVLPQNATYGYFLGARAAYLDNGNSFAALNVNKLNSRSKYILGGDIAANTFSVTDCDKDDYTTNPLFPGGKIPFHNGNVNLLFADGSVRQAKSFDSNAMEYSYSGTWAAPY